MQPIYTCNDTSIEIQIIEKGCYYKANIPNNEANKMLIENTVFKFDKCGSVIIMHDNNNVFQLYKMECNYSDYIEMQNKLEHLKNENDILNNKITDKNQLQQQLNIYYEEQIDQFKKETYNLKNELIEIKTLLHQQIKLSNDKSLEDIKVKEQFKEINYYLPFVFKSGGGNYDRTNYGNEQIVTYNQECHAKYYQFFNSQKDVKLTIQHTNKTNIIPNYIYEHIIIPPGKVLILMLMGLKYYGLKVYNKGIHYNIELGEVIMFINEKNISNIIDLYKKEQAVKIFGNLSITHFESECLQE